MADNNSISVIVPVFNTPNNWIDGCIASIIDQDASNIEIVIVDDGSEEWCARHCDELALKHSIVRVLHQTNQGVSAARNNAISIARGEYITFVDSDDEITPDFVASSIRLLIDNKADAVFGCHVESYGDIQNSRQFGLNGGVIAFSGSEIDRLYRYFLSYATWKNNTVPAELPRSLHAKMYKRSVLEHIRFDERLSILEDGVFNADFCQKAEKILLNDSPWYIYRVNAGSACHNVGLGERIEAQKDAVSDHIVPGESGGDLVASHICGFVFMALLGGARTGNLSYHDVKTCISHCLVQNAFKRIRLDAVDFGTARKLLYFLARRRLCLGFFILLVIKVALDEKKGRRVS